MNEEVEKVFYRQVAGMKRGGFEFPAQHELKAWIDKNFIPRVEVEKAIDGLDELDRTGARNCADKESAYRVGVLESQIQLRQALLRSLLK